MMYCNSFFYKYVMKYLDINNLFIILLYLFLTFCLYSRGKYFIYYKLN